MLRTALSYDREEHALKAAGWDRVPGQALLYRIALDAPPDLTLPSPGSWGAPQAFDHHSKESPCD